LRRPPQRLRAHQGSRHRRCRRRALRGPARLGEEVGHLGGKVLVPTSQHIRTLSAARLAADVLGVPTIIIARTDSEAATLITSDVDPRDAAFTTGERTAEGFYRTTPGIDAVVARALAYAPYADLIWVETATPDLGLARRVAEAVHAQFP